jgi:SAM-dependent methyltransferase
VMSGPFAGMAFARHSTHGCHAPKLIGCYEAELHTVMAEIVATPYRDILNIGCAEGYYAVGLARLMAEVRVVARDLNPAAQAVTRDVAARNGVGDRVSVGGLFACADFAAYGEGRTLVLCDIEGAEDELLDPVAAPGLVRFDLLVEAHDAAKPGLSARLADRFAATHDIQRIGPEPLNRHVPDVFATLGDLEQMMLVWEWRTGPTPWLWMKARARA